MYKLLESQKRFLEVPHNEKLDVAVYQGGFGSGKTFAGSLLGVLLCLKYPKIRGLVGAQTYALVRDTTLAAYFEHLEAFNLTEGADWEFVKSEGKLKFKNGSEVLFRHFDEPNKLKSLNLGFAEIEEMSDIPESTFKMLLGRMRQPILKEWKGFKYRIFGHTNPEGRKGWIYKTFIGDSLKGEGFSQKRKRVNYRLIVAPTTENTHLPEGFCEELKKLYDEKYYRLNVLGEWDDYDAGLIVKGFGDDNIKNVDYDRDADLHITCDFNVDPMCWILAHKNESTVSFFDEIVLENTTTAQCAQEFASRYSGHCGRIVINGDASGDNRSVTSEYTNYILMRKVLSASGFREADIEIRRYNPPIKNRILAFNSMVRNAAGEARLFISPKCEKLLYNIRNLRYREGTSMLDLPGHYRIKNAPELKFLGHPFDAASYLVEYYFPIKA